MKEELYEPFVPDIQAVTDHPKETKEQSTQTNCDRFNCGICLDLPTSPVVTECGHLFCWLELETWLQQQSICPLCKSICIQITPIYDGTDNSGSTRPKGRRIEVTQKSYFGDNYVSRAFMMMAIFVVLSLVLY